MLHPSPTTSHSSWKFLSNHGQVLLAVAGDPNVRIREIALQLGITERATQSLLNDLVIDGYVERRRVGRRNTYRIDPDAPFRHPALAEHSIRGFLMSLVPWGQAPNDPPRAATPAETTERLRVLEQSGLSEHHQHAALHDLTKLASDLLATPIAFVSLIAERDQVVKTVVGLPDTIVHSRTPLENSFAHLLSRTGHERAVPDILDEPELRDNPTANRFGARACAGVPLITSQGVLLGALCVVDTKPRHWTQADMNLLKTIGRAANAQADNAILAHTAQTTADHYRALLDHLPDAIILVADRDLRLTFASGGSLSRVGIDPATAGGQDLNAVLGSRRSQLVPHFQAGLDGSRHSFPLAAADGELYTVHMIPIRDSAGDIHSVMAFAQRVALARAAA